MKIAIVTLPLHNNYGGILQAYALQTVLERMGHEAMVVSKERVPQLSGVRKYWKIFSRSVRRYLLHGPVVIFSERERQQQYRVALRDIQPFIDQHIHVCMLDRVSQLKQTDMDAIVVGSDQIWRSKYIRSVFREPVANAFLGFAQRWNVVRLSYAASFGTDEWEYTPCETHRIRALLRQFDAVSVREEKGRLLCLNKLGIEACHVLDPTMLLDKADYEALLSPADGLDKRADSLLYYVLDNSPEIDELVRAIANEKALSILRIGIYDYEGGKAVQPSVEQWLDNFRQASFVVTDSYHACVFSILFGKPFVAIGNKNRGYGRFLSLMQSFGLEKNLLSTPSEYDPCESYDIPISSYALLDEKRKESQGFLINVLGYENS